MILVAFFATILVGEAMRRLHQDDCHYSTGQASRMLHCSQAKVRRWCEEGLIECASTEGGHYRISGAAIEQIQKHGEPELPRRPANPRGSVSLPSRRALDSLPPDLYREASDRLAESAEGVKIIENRVRRRKLELEGEQIEDEFRLRDERRAAEERESRREIAEANRKEQRNRWLREKINWALAPEPLPPGWETVQIALELQGVGRSSAAGLPADAPIEVKVAVAKGVLRLLESVDPAVMSDDLLNEQIAALVKAIRGACRQREQAEQMAQDRHRMDTLKAIAEIIGNRNAACAHQAKRNLEAITAIANADRQRLATTSVPVQNTTVPPQNLCDEREEEAAAEEAEDAAVERLVNDSLIDEVAAYLRELHEEDPDLFGQGNAGKLNRWEAERKFREVIHDDVLGLVDEDLDITDEDMKIEIRNAVDRYWGDVIDDGDDR